jgi:hypothetical protein
MMRVPFAFQVVLAALVGGGAVAVAQVPTQRAVFSQAAASPACNIKGNISIGTGERIYHMPGQHWYAETKISPEYGERWFCSEAEARAAGWRKARD